ncbi:MAG: ComEA family DNA-binding protein [Candidatus Kryptoniota bacterium]
MLSRFIHKIQEKFGLSKSESKIILFLTFGMLIGGFVKILQEREGMPRYDYRQTDAIFAESASKVDSIISIEEDTSKVSASAQHKKKLAVSPVDINIASAEELTSLPGIGQATAERIVEYRKIHGKFASIEDLMNVKGIGEKKFQKLRSLVVVH